MLTHDVIKSKQFLDFVNHTLRESIAMQDIGGDTTEIAVHLRGEAIRYQDQQGIGGVLRLGDGRWWTFVSAVRAASSVHSIIQSAARSARDQERQMITIDDIVEAQAALAKRIWPF